MRGKSGLVEEVCVCRDRPGRLAMRCGADLLKNGMTFTTVVCLLA